MDEDEDSFETVLHKLRSLSGKRDPRSVRLAAVTSALLDIIEGDVTAAKVFASAIATLEGTLQQEQRDSFQALNSLATQSALLELLCVTVAHVAPATIDATISVSSRTLRAVVATCNEINHESIGEESMVDTKDELGGISSVLRAVSRASGEVLRHILPNSSQEKVIRQFLYGTFFALLQDKRPKVRKASQNAVCELLMAPSCHPVIRKATSTYIHSQLDALRRKLQDDFDQKDMLHLLAFVQESILFLDTSKLGGDLMEMLMSMFQLDVKPSESSASNFVSLSKKDSTARILTINALLSTVLPMVEVEDVASDEQRNNLNQFSSRVLASLLQVQPSLIFRDGCADTELLETGRTKYGQLVLAACQRIFASGELQTGCKLLPLSIQMALNLSRASLESQHSACAELLMVELTKLFQTHLKPLRETEPKLHGDCSKSCLRGLEQILVGVTYQETWFVSLQALASLIQQMDSEDPTVDAAINSILQLRSRDGLDKDSRQAVDSTVASLIQGLGIERIWKSIKWTNGDQEIYKEQVWILPIMKTTSPTRPRLAFFHTSVLKLARFCDSLSVQRSKETEYYKSRVIDLWSLLPCFCRSPCDLDTAFPKLVPILIKAISDTRYRRLVGIVGNGLTVLCSSVSERLQGGVESEQLRQDASTIANECSKLLPSLFKVVDSLHATTPQGKDQMDMDDAEHSDVQASEDMKQVQYVTQAIASLAKLAPKPFLQILFKKVVQRLLEASQSDEDHSEKMCSLLSLSQALVSSETLDESSIHLLYRSLKPLIRTDEMRPRVQKRAYKVLAEICQRYHSLMADGESLNELCELLASSMVTSQVSARYMRLKCLQHIVDGLDASNNVHIDIIPKLSGEVLLCLKDSNGKTREAAFQLLLSMANAGGNKTDFIRSVTAGLGAETSHMRSASVMALSRLVYEYARNELSVQALLPSLLQTTLVLFDDSSREVIKSVVGFVRVAIAAMPEDQLQPLLPEVVGGLLKYHKGKDRFRAKIKIILKRLVKLYGFDALEPLVPEGDSRLLTHMRKLSEREARRKAKAADQRRQESRNFDEMIDSDEEDSDDGRTLMTGATGFTRMTGRTGKSMKSGAGLTNAKSRSSRTGIQTVASTKSASDPSIRIRNDKNGEIFDVAELTTKSVRFEADDSDSDSDNGAIEFDASGKLVVRDDFEEKQTTDDTGTAVDDDVIMVAGKKRRISKFESIKAGSDGQGGKKAKGKRVIPAPGASYKSKKAGGDVMRKGQKYEPYAFVPLDGKNYTKKNRRQAVEQMSTVVRGGTKRKKR